MSLSYGKRCLIFTLFAALATAAVVGCHYLDRFLGVVDGAQLAVKLLIFALGVLFFAASPTRRAQLKGSRSVTWYLLALVPFAFQLVAAYSAVDRSPAVFETLSWLVAVIATVLWEEMCFRYVAAALFVREGKIPLPAVALSAFVFSLSHAVNLLANPLDATLVQMAYAAVSGIFLLGLLLRSGNLLACIIAHFAVNATSQFFAHFSSAPRLNDSPWLLVAECVVLALLGVWMLLPYCKKDKNT